MRKIGFMTNGDDTKEILPKTYKIDQIANQRKMFCTLINQYLSKKAQITTDRESLFNYSLLEIFEQKILSFFQFYAFKPQSAQKVVHIFATESILFGQYFKQSKIPKMRYMTKNIHFKHDFKMELNYEHPAAELIQLIFNGKEIQMMLDLNEIFTHTVFERIKREKDKKVTLDAPYIHIDQNGLRTRLYPRWKKVSSDSLHLRDNDIQEGFDQLHNNEIDQCYLVYPKTDNFQKHITILDKTKEKHLKMIPYSFTFCTREKKCKK